MKKFAVRYFLIWMLLSQSCKAFSLEGEEKFPHKDSATFIAQRLKLEYLYFKSDDEQEKIKCKIQIARLYEQEGNFNSALDELKFISDKDSVLQIVPMELVYEGISQKAFCLFMTDEFAKADSTIKKLFARYPDSLYSKRAGIISVLTFNHLEKFSEAQNHLTGLLLRYQRDTSGISKAYADAKSTRYKSVKKTIRLSEFIPGAGFFYMKKYSEGTTSLLLNLTFIGYTAYSIYTQYYITALFTGVTNFMRFHSGGIKASSTLAKQFNERAKKTSLQALDNFCVQKLSE